LTLLRISIFIIVFLLQLIASAQENTNAIFTTASGLPDNNVTCMLTDKQGFIWLGTSNGLCRFDGTHFYTLPKGILQSNRVAGDLILDLEEDGDYIWAAHRFGLSRINKYSFECANFQNNEPGPHYTNRRSIRDIYKDSLGNIWLAGDHQLLQFNRKTNAIITIIDFEKILPPGRYKKLSKIIPNGQNVLMLFLVRGWVKYNIYKNAIDTLELNTIPVKLLKGENLRLRAYWNSFLSTLFVAYNTERKTIAISDKSIPNAVGRTTNIYVDSNLNILINQEQNLQTTLLNSNPVLTQEMNEHYSLKGLAQPFNFIQYSNGIPCWGSINGLHVVNSHSKYLRKYFLKNTGNDFLRSAPDILDVKEYSNSEWLIATKGGLYLLDRATNITSSFIRWQDSTIYKILLLPDKTVWLSTSNHLWHFNPKTQLTEKPVALESYAVSIIHLDNKIMVTTRSDGMLIINQNTLQLTKLKKTDNNRQISSNRITAIKPVAGSGNFIITYNSPPGHYSYTNFKTGLYKPDSIPLEAYALHEKFSIESVLPALKQLWFGSNLGGVHLYDSVSNSWTNFTNKDGMGNNSVFEIIQDNQNRIWLFTDIGIDVYDNHNRQLYNFPIKLITGGQIGGFINGNGNLICFDSKNIFEINLAGFDLNTSNKNILLSQISQGDKQFSLREYFLNLPYDKNSFSISFSLQKIDPIETRYAYRLSFADDWKEIGTQTQLNFASLEPGNYQLQIKATDEFGQWKNFSVPFPIIIQSPFWNTWWFFVLIFVSAIVATWYIITVIQKRKLKKIQQENEVIRLKTEQELTVAKERERIIADLHDDVGATLSSIHIYSELAGNLVNARPAESQEMMNKISQQGKDLLGNMSDIIWSLKPASDEQYSFARRLLNYSQELLAAKNIQAHFAIDELLAAQIINPQVRKNILLIAKEAMNNIAKYSNAGKAIITLEKKETMVVLCVEDNGQGFDTTNAKHGNGLHNMQQRCQQLEGVFEISSSTGKGTSLSCHFPIAIISHPG